jgi:tetratricopeptide (TPR) repeat protein/DNA-binding Xre family transcriptional regulator
MRLLRPLRSFLLLFLRLLKRKTINKLSRASGYSTKQIGSIERGRVKKVADEDLQRLFDALGCSEAEVVLVSSCLEALAELDPDADPALTAAQERYLAAARRRLRSRMGAGGESPVEAPVSEYPCPYEVELDRIEAGGAWERLREAKTLSGLTGAVRSGRAHGCEYRLWAFAERLCEESVRAASQDPRRALDLAIVAVRVALHLKVWEPWRVRLLGFAVAHRANALRVAGRLGASDRTFALARRLWTAGLDPDRLLDPGRLLDLEASLRRAQRRFAEALDLLEKATPLTRRPEHVALNTAFTLDAMGEYRRAIQILKEVGPLVEAHPERRLKSIQRFNLAVALSHVGLHQQAARLLPPLRRLVEKDEQDRIRFRWLEGRISAGLGRTDEALRALADARAGFTRHGLSYDVALSLVETAAILLERGDYPEVQRLATELADVFKKNGIHEEARKALRLFEEAVARQAATVELARLLLAWLFRARHDHGLVFTPPAGF